MILTLTLVFDKGTGTICMALMVTLIKNFMMTFIFMDCFWNAGSPYELPLAHVCISTNEVGSKSGYMECTLDCFFCYFHDILQFIVPSLVRHVCSIFLMAA